MNFTKYNIMQHSFCIQQLKLQYQVQIFFLFILQMKKQQAKNQMPPSTKRRRMPKVFTERMKNLKKGKSVFKTCPDQLQWLQQQNCQLINVELKKKKIAKKSVMNFTQSMNNEVSDHFILTLFGMITIDERALKYHLKDQSLITSVFHFYNLVKIEARPEWLLLRIQKTKDNQYPMQLIKVLRPYFIQRFRNLGDAYFYQLANKIQKVYQIMYSVKASHSSSFSFTQMIENHFLQKNKDKPFLLRVVPNKLYFSKELIQISGCSVNQLANECIRFRSLVAEFFNADNYRQQIDNFFDFFDLRIQLTRGQIDENEYVSRLIQRPVQYITCRDESVLKVVTKKYNIAPGVGCWQIQQILGREQINPQRYRALSKSKYKFYQDNKWAQLKRMDKLFTIPQNQLVQNEGKICSYKEVKFTM